MTTLAEEIQKEARSLPDNLASQVYDFIRFIEARHDIPPLAEDSQRPGPDSFLARHARSVADAVPARPTRFPLVNASCELWNLKVL